MRFEQGIKGIDHAKKLGLQNGEGDQLASLLDDLMEDLKFIHVGKLVFITGLRYT